MNYRMSMDRVDRSNRQAKQERAYCGVHLTSRPGKDISGNWYSQCWTGHNIGEQCKIMIVKPDGSEVEYGK